jgi:hypothetical protein
LDEVIAAAPQSVRQYNLARRPLSIPKIVYLLREQGLVDSPGTLTSQLHDAAGGEVNATRDDHGNFAADLFEFWFEALCRTLQSVYGQCPIHMDGAPYHKRRRDRPPTAADKVDVIRSWLTEHGAPVLPGDKKHELLARTPAEHMRPRYVSLAIAEEYGHRVLFTPPYHPDLQPIEVTCGVIKNHIADDPARTMTALGVKIVQSCSIVTEKTWLAVRAKALKKEDEYWASLDEDYFEVEDEGAVLEGAISTNARVAAAGELNFG